MYEITVLIKNSVYPFGQNLDMQTVKIQQTQRFTSVESLKQKKSEMLRKADMLNNPYIIQLLAVYQENMYLKYQWQYVPHNFQSYIENKFNTSSKQIWKMTKNLLLKKISFELTMLMSYLSKMKIEADFSVQNIGITNDQKLKFYLNPKTRMGIRSQLSLIAVYGQAKEKVLKQFQAKLQKIERQQEGQQRQQKYNFKANRNYYEQKMHNNSFVQSMSSSIITNRTNRQIPKEKKQQIFQKPQRKMSFNNFGNAYNSDIKSNFERANSNHKHKYSFQYNAQQQQQNKQPKNNFRDYKNFKANTTYNNEKDEDDSQSLNHSKSIKIQLQQKQTLDNKKKRKDSYKVKITTYHEYQLDDCPPQFFKTNNDEDIFEHFAKRAQKEEKKQYQQDNSYQDGRFKSQNTKQGNQFATQAPSPIFSTGSNISQRIKMARQRSQQALNKIKFLKK